MAETIKPGMARIPAPDMAPVRDWLRSIFLVDLLKGLWLTLRYTPQPAFTFQYPAERRPVAPRFRGILRLQGSARTT